MVDVMRSSCVVMELSKSCSSEVFLVEYEGDECLLNVFLRNNRLLGTNNHHDIKDNGDITELDEHHRIKNSKVIDSNQQRDSGIADCEGEGEGWFICNVGLFVHQTTFMMPMKGKQEG